MTVPPALDRYRPIVDDFPLFVEACQTPLRTTFRVSRNRALNASMPFWLSSLSPSVQGIPWIEGAYRLRDTDLLPFIAGYLGGLFHIQEESSMLPVALLQVQAGDRVLDLCAAPGNKTTQLADAVGPSGTVVANDTSRSRLGVVRTTIDRLGHTNIFVTAKDARRYPEEAGLFDRVLADVPCTCEGTSRRHPNVLSASNRDFRAQLIEIQKLILENALHRCRPGGLVAYATCTFAPEECEGVVSAVLETTAVGRSATLVPVSVPGLATRPGLRRFDGTAYHPDLRHAVRLWPHESDTGGFFVAILQKDADDGDPDTRIVSSADGTAGSEQLPEKAAVQETAELTAIIENDLRSYDIPPGVSDKFVATGDSRKYLSIVSRSSRPPPAEMVIGAGIRGINVKGDPHRLSTAGIMQLGPHAGRGLIDLDLNQLRVYLAREMLHVPSPEGRLRSNAGSDSRRPVAPSEMPLGSCLVQCGGLVFGRGTLQQHPHFTELTSLFPRIWAGVDVPARLREIDDGAG